MSSESFTALTLESIVELQSSRKKPRQSCSNIQQTMSNVKRRRRLRVTKTSENARFDVDDIEVNQNFIDKRVTKVSGDQADNAFNFDHCPNSTFKLKNGNGCVRTLYRGELFKLKCSSNKSNVYWNCWECKASVKTSHDGRLLSILKGHTCQSNYRAPEDLFQMKPSIRPEPILKKGDLITYDGHDSSRCSSCNTNDSIWESINKVSADLLPGSNIQLEIVDTMLPTVPESNLEMLQPAEPSIIDESGSVESNLEELGQVESNMEMKTTIADLKNLVCQLRHGLSSLNFNNNELALVNEHRELKKRHALITQQYIGAQNKNQWLKESVIELDEQRNELRTLNENYRSEIVKYKLEMKNVQTERAECENRLWVEFKKKCDLHDKKMYELREINTQLCKELKVANFQMEHYSAELFAIQHKSGKSISEINITIDDTETDIDSDDDAVGDVDGPSSVPKASTTSNTMKSNSNANLLPA